MIITYFPVDEVTHQFRFRFRRVLSVSCRLVLYFLPMVSVATAILAFLMTTCDLSLHIILYVNYVWVNIASVTVLCSGVNSMISKLNSPKAILPLRERYHITERAARFSSQRPQMPRGLTFIAPSILRGQTRSRVATRSPATSAYPDQLRVNERSQLEQYHSPS